MTDTTTPEPVTSTWLSGFLDEAAARNLCVRVGCTTCGAMEFRYGLYARAAATLGIAPLSRFPGHTRVVKKNVGHLRTDRRIQSELVRQLSFLNPDPAKQLKWIDAIRLIFCELWWTMGVATAEREYQPVLEGTWAGSVLRTMQEHHRHLSEQRRQRELAESTQAVQARRQAKRKLKQQAHAERIARKAERDKLWFEQHPRPHDPDSREAGREE